MKIILWKKITLLFKNRRMGDFVCNFTAVVLGIILTFMGSGLDRETKYATGCEECPSVSKSGIKG